VTSVARRSNKLPAKAGETKERGRCPEIEVQPLALVQEHS